MKTNQVPLSLFISVIAISLISIFTGPTARAHLSGHKCVPVLTSSGDVQVNRQWDPSIGHCFLDVHPRNVTDLKYRDYYFDNLGHFMVFNSYGDGPDNVMTGARDFYLFPIVEEMPDFTIEKNGDVIVKMVSGHRLQISSTDFSIVSLTPGHVTESSLSSDNAGGVEISLSEGFWIDGGFKKGASPLSDASASSLVMSAKSQGTCTLPNGSYLNYLASGDYAFKYENADWLSFLKTNCPTLQF